MPISIPDLFKIPLIYSIDLASDGRLVLYSSNPTGIPHLYIVETKPGSKPKQLTSGNDPVIFGSLSPSGDNILYLQDKDGNELHHLFLVSKEGEKAQQITKNPFRTWYVEWHPNGKEAVRSYVTKKSCGLEIFNLRTRENFVLKEQKTPFFDVRYSHDGKWIACTEWGGGKDPKNQQVVVVNRNDPTDTISYKFKDGSKEMHPSWAPNDKKLAFLSDVNGRNQVVIQDFQGEERLFLDLEEGEEAIDMQEIGWAPTGDKVYYIVSKHSRTKLYEHPLDGEKTALPFPEGTILTFRISKNGKTVVAVHSSMTSPYGIYLHETGSNIITPLTSRKYKVNLAELAKPKSVWYKSSDGLKIHAWYLPAGHGTPPYPAVVWPHGGPWWQTYDTWNPYLQSISQSGFAVLAPNFRGSTGYGAEFRNLDLSDPGGGDLEDVVSGAEWLGKQSEIDSSKIAIMGGSYGGFMTLIALTKKPEVFAAGVAVVPVTDWLEMYELSDAAFRRFMEELFEGPPDKKEELYRDRSPITYISQIKAPVLIIHGRHDSRCPIQPVEKFVKKLNEMTHPHEFRVQEKEGHGFARVDANIQEVKTAVEYLRKTLL
ncbi:MAG: alpha/beta fold hydrolase [Candidatus Bathyarchaeia archaeon]